MTEALLDGVEWEPEGKRAIRTLNAHQVELVLRRIEDPRDRALFWLIYDGDLRCQEALAIDIDDICWTERSIRIHGKSDRPREMFFSRAVGTLLDKYLATRLDRNMLYADGESKLAQGLVNHQAISYTRS